MKFERAHSEPLSRADRALALLLKNWSKRITTPEARAEKRRQHCTPLLASLLLATSREPAASSRPVVPLLQEAGCCEPTSGENRVEKSSAPRASDTIGGRCVCEKRAARSYKWPPIPPNSSGWVSESDSEKGTTRARTQSAIGAAIETECRPNSKAPISRQPHSSGACYLLAVALFCSRVLSALERPPAAGCALLFCCSTAAELHLLRVCVCV